MSVLHVVQSMNISNKRAYVSAYFRENKKTNRHFGLSMKNILRSITSCELRIRAITTRQQFCGDISTLFQSHCQTKHHFTCTSSHLIYCISCSRCGMLHIGETGRNLRTRFGEHRRAVTSNDAN